MTRLAIHLATGCVHRQTKLLGIISQTCVHISYRIVFKYVLAESLKNPVALCIFPNGPNGLHGNGQNAQIARLDCMCRPAGPNIEGTKFPLSFHESVSFNHKKTLSNVGESLVAISSNKS